MTPQVLEKLKATEARYEELTALVSDSSVQADPAAYRTHSKALSELQELVDLSREHRALAAQLADAQEMAAGGDAEMRQMADEEARAILPKLEVLFEQIRLLLIPRDPNDDKNIVLEIRAGTGGDEATL